MKLLIFTISMIFLFSACGSDDTLDAQEQEFFEFENGKQISIEQYDPSKPEDEAQKFVNVCEGDFTVFKYSLVNSGEEGIADSGFREYVYFQIDSDLENFEFTNEELSQVEATYQLSCFCPTSIVNPSYIERGTISGQKLEDNSWNINIDVEIGDNDVVDIEASFSMKEDLFLCNEMDTANPEEFLDEETEAAPINNDDDFSISEENIDHIETIQFLGQAHSCMDIFVSVLDKQIDSKRTLGIGGASKNTLMLTNEPKTFDLPLNNFGLLITDYDSNVPTSYLSYCDDVSFETWPNAIDSWFAISGKITMSVSDVEENSNIYNLNISLENVIFENKEEEKLKIEELGLEDLEMGFFPG